MKKHWIVFVLAYLGITGLLTIGCKSSATYSEIDKVLIENAPFPVKISYEYPEWNFFRIQGMGDTWLVCNPFEEMEEAAAQLDSTNVKEIQMIKILSAHHYAYISTEILDEMAYRKIFKFKKNKMSTVSDTKKPCVVYALIYKADTSLFCFEIDKMPSRIRKLDEKLKPLFDCNAQDTEFIDKFFR
ncbi:MAG: hypothetical protein R3C61_18100 [Bacteroidia bacterium]